MFKGMNRDIAHEIRQLIEDHLQVGMPSEKIEAFLSKHFNGGSFDRFNRSYNAIIRDVAHDPNLDQAVVIYLYVDDTKSFVRSEVFDSFTDSFRK